MEVYPVIDGVETLRALQRRLAHEVKVLREPGRTAESDQDLFKQCDTNHEQLSQGDIKIGSQQLNKTCTVCRQ